MKRSHPFKYFAAVSGLSLLPITAFSQEGLDQSKMEETMKKYAMPGPQHKELRSCVGIWKAESSYWMQPGGEPMKTMGESTVRMLMQGRYLREQYSTEFPGMGLFKGEGTLAYDRVSEEYIHTWVDNMGTGVMVSRGKVSEGGTTVEMKATHKNYMTMQDVKYRMVYHFGDGKTRKFEMFATYPGKPEYKHMEISYTKVGNLKKKGAKTGASAGAIIGGALGGTEQPGNPKKEKEKE